MKKLYFMTLPLSFLFMIYGVVMMITVNEILFYIGFILIMINTFVYFNLLINTLYVIKRADKWT